MIVVTGESVEPLRRVCAKALAETAWAKHPSEDFPADSLALIMEERAVCQQIAREPA